MPIYEYRCPNGHTFEVFQRISDPAAETCEVCGAGPVEKLLFPVAVHFKGAGFYSTDYGKRGRKAGKEGEPAAGAPKEGAKESAAAPGAGEKSGGEKKPSSE